MGIVIGIDEAGLGPNLGPLVVAATMFEVPGDPADFDFWQALQPVVTRDPQPDDGRIAIADSKALFAPGRGIGSLERVVLAVIEGDWPATLDEVWSRLGQRAQDRPAEPWLQTTSDVAPVRVLPDNVAAVRQSWRQGLAEAGCRCLGVQARIIQPAEFNGRFLPGVNKSDVTSAIHLELLRRLLPRACEDRVLVVSDKHGGRNRYAALLATLDLPEWITPWEEGPALSRYCSGPIEFRFQPRAEQHLPVALASMTAKYVRELQMGLFNRYWQTQRPGLKPTQGYPVDARRFWSEIDGVREALAIPRAAIWRER